MVSLQEVARFAVVNPATGAVSGGADYLAALEAQLAARGLDYQVTAVQENTSSALPLAVDFSTFQISSVLAFTDRLVTLTRGDVQVNDVGRTYHVVNTHLETQGLAPVQAAQAAELLSSVLADLEGITVLTGDLNSDAEAGPGAPSWTPTYQALLDFGFADAWLLRAGNPRADGFTCCQDPDLQNGASLLDERIDLVLVRSSDGKNPVRGAPGAIHTDRVGEEQADRLDATGLRPADHAGLAAIIRAVDGSEDSDG